MNQSSPTARKQMPQPRTPDGRLFLSATEVGHQLGLKRSRVYELAATGMLPVVRLGRRLPFPRRGLEALAEVAIERVRAELRHRLDDEPHSRRVV